MPLALSCWTPLMTRLSFELSCFIKIGRWCTVTGLDDRRNERGHWGMSIDSSRWILRPRTLLEKSRSPSHPLIKKCCFDWVAQSWISAFLLFCNASYEIPISHILRCAIYTHNGISCIWKPNITAAALLQRFLRVLLLHVPFCPCQCMDNILHCCRWEREI